MARRIALEPHLTIEELEGRYRSTKDPVERSRWQFLWLLACGLTANVIASLTGYWRFSARQVIGLVKAPP
jgi:hypothetical protein